MPFTPDRSLGREKLNAAMKERRGTNAAWHEANRMLRNASTEERIRWHLEHAKECGCRPIPPRLQEEIARRGGA